MPPKAQHEGQAGLPEEAITKLTAIDRLTKWTAVSISRRAFLTRLTTAGTIVLGIQLFKVLPVAAQSCNRCDSPCGSCSTENAYCCSPNGVNCSPPLICSCSSGCACCFYSSTVICDDNSRSFSCPNCDPLLCA
jgi:hypothetical protein